MKKERINNINEPLQICNGHFFAYNSTNCVIVHILNPKTIN